MTEDWTQLASYILSLRQWLRMTDTDMLAVIHRRGNASRVSHLRGHTLTKPLMWKETEGTDETILCIDTRVSIHTETIEIKGVFRASICSYSFRRVAI